MKEKVITITLLSLLMLCAISSDSYLWLSFNQSSVSEYNGGEESGVRLINKDIETGTALQGSSFELVTANKTEGLYVTDENGVISLNGLNKGERYLFKEVDLKYGYTSDKDIFPFVADGSEIEVIGQKNSKRKAELSIKFEISNLDYNRNEYIVTSADNSFPFEHIIAIGEDDDKLYPYRIIDKNGRQIENYQYEYENGYVITVYGSGATNNGGSIALRNGETALIDIKNAPLLLSYKISQKSYLTKYESSNSEQVGYMNGWISTSLNTYGNISDEPVEAKFKSCFVPPRTDMNKASLAVVNRIKSEHNSFDYSQEFKTEIVIGEDENTDFYYEVIHTRDAGRYIPDYPFDYDYYYPDDPLLENSKSTVSDVDILFGERWAQIDGSTGELKRSSGNKISVNMRHNTAVIIYDVPEGTHYEVTQLDYLADGFSIFNCSNIEGYVSGDARFEEKAARTSVFRTRVDLFNTQIATITRPVTVKASPLVGADKLDIDFVNIADGIAFGHCSLSSENGWQGSADLPIYNPQDGEVLEYGVRAHFPERYKLNSYEAYDDFFEFGGVKEPDVLYFGVRNIIDGIPPKDEKFIFDVRAVAPGTPLPSYDTSVTVSGEGTGFFGNIKFLPNDRNGTRFYEYEILQRAGKLSDFEYDNATYTVKVQVVEYNKMCNVKIVSVGGGAFADGMFTFNNRYERRETQTKGVTLAVRKIVDGEGGDKDKPFSFVAEIGNQTHEFELKHGEVKEFKLLTFGTPYRITEKAEEHYKTESFKNVGVIGNTDLLSNFINTYTPDEEKETGELVITKEIEGDDLAQIDFNKKFRFTVTIGTKRHTIDLRAGESRNFGEIKIGTPYNVVERDYSKAGYITISLGSRGIIQKGENNAFFLNYKREIIKSYLVVTNLVADGDSTKVFDYHAIIGEESYDFSLCDGEMKLFEDIRIGTEYSVTQKDYSQEGYLTMSFADSGIILENGTFARFINIGEIAQPEEAPPPPTNDPTEPTNPTDNSQENNTPNSDNSSPDPPTPPKTDEEYWGNTELVDKDTGNNIALLFIQLAVIIAVLRFILLRKDRIKECLCDIWENAVNFIKTLYK